MWILPAEWRKMHDLKKKKMSSNCLMSGAITAGEEKSSGKGIFSDYISSAEKEKDKPTSKR